MGKRIFASAFVFMLSAFIISLGLFITGCGNASIDGTVGTMKIQPTTLNADESKIVELLQYTDATGKIYEYSANSDLKTVEVTCYKLDDTGKWVARYGPLSIPVEEATGRVAISFDYLANGLEVAVQNESGTTGGSSSPGDNIDADWSISETAYADVTDIKYGKEIPLVMQAHTSEDQLISGDISLFYQPEEILKHGSGEVYVVAIKFSKESIQ